MRPGYPFKKIHFDEMTNEEVRMVLFHQKEICLLCLKLPPSKFVKSFK